MHAVELACRESSGLLVRLLWEPRVGTVVVSVEDVLTGHDFELSVRPESALDAFHPFAYELTAAAHVEQRIWCAESVAIDEERLCGYCHCRLGNGIAEDSTSSRLT